MSVVTEILSLRRNQFSSMTTLLSAIDRYWATQCDEHVVGRKYAVFEAADMLLINVAPIPSPIPLCSHYFALFFP